MGVPRTIEIGAKFGRLTVIRRRVANESTVLCRCACGTEKEIRFLDLGRRTFSCGCYLRERISETHRTHGRSKTKLYRAWAGMHARCRNPNHDGYATYGGRGITVCERWHSFENFLADMGERPPGHSIDRIDVDGNYEPDNCRWATDREQANNRRPRSRPAECKKGHLFTAETAYVAPSTGRRSCKICAAEREQRRVRVPRTPSTTGATTA